MSDNHTIPTLGYPSQSAAVRALYEQGYEAADIAEMVGASTNSVHRSLAEMRRKQGIAAPQRRGRPRRVSLAVEVWPKTAHQWRLMNHQKATAGAREALEAMRK